MATSVGIRCGGANRFLDCRREPENPYFGYRNAGAGSGTGPASVSVSNRRSFCRMRASTPAAGIAKESREEAVVCGKMDGWMRDSVAEIVKNLREAPLLVHVYASRDGKTPATLKTEKAVEEESWPVVVERWRRKESPLPEGVIFVEQLAGEEEEEVAAAEEVTRAWGIVVQGKGAECGPICYLLKTSRGGAGLGGLCCTHFCLTRVRSFRETARSQLKNCWLSQAR